MSRSNTGPRRFGSQTELAPAVSSKTTQRLQRIANLRADLHPIAKNRKVSRIMRDLATSTFNLLEMLDEKDPKQSVIIEAALMLTRESIDHEQSMQEVRDNYEDLVDEQAPAEDIGRQVKLMLRDLYQSTNAPSHSAASSPPPPKQEVQHTPPPPPSPPPKLTAHPTPQRETQLSPDKGAVVPFSRSLEKAVVQNPEPRSHDSIGKQVSNSVSPAMSMGSPPAPTGVSQFSVVNATEGLNMTIAKGATEKRTYGHTFKFASHRTTLPAGDFSMRDQQKGTTYINNGNAEFNFGGTLVFD